MNVIEYPSIETSKLLTDNLDDVRGRFFQFEGGQYVQVETSTNGAVILWSSKVALSELCRAAHESTGEPSEEPGSGFLITEGGDRRPDDAASSLEETALKNELAVRRFSAVYGDGATISWRRPQVKMAADTEAYVEIGYSANTVDLGHVWGLLAATATEAVRLNVEKDTEPLVAALGSTVISY